MLPEILQAFFRKQLGEMGQNMNILFFPAKTRDGAPLADPQGNGSLFAVIRKVVGVDERVFEWKLPLTSLSPPKFCPVGGEKVEASWIFCPWHGNRLIPAAPQSQ